MIVSRVIVASRCRLAAGPPGALTYITPVDLDSNGLSEFVHARSLTPWLVAAASVGASGREVARRFNVASSRLNLPVVQQALKDVRLTLWGSIEASE